MSLNYSQYRYDLIGQRWCYAYTIYIFAQQFSLIDKRLPHFVGQVIDLKNNLVSFYWIYKKNEFEQYVEYYRDKINLIEGEILAIESFIPELFNSNKNFDARDYIECVIRAFRLPTILRGIDHGLLPQLKSFLSDEEIGLFAQPTKPAAAIAEERELIGLANNHTANKVEDRILEQIYDRYRWLYGGYYNEKPKEQSWYIAELKRLKSLDQNTHIKDLNVDHKEIKFDSYNKDEQSLIRLAQESAYLKDSAKFLINRLLGNFNQLWDKWSVEHGIESELLRYFLPMEIVDVFEDRKVDFNQIRDRKQLLFIGRPEGFVIKRGDSAEEFRSTYLKLKGITELKGRVTAKGKAYGKVKIVLGQSDFAKFQEGDILVVCNTTPDYLLIIHKAAAIVAEEGGVTAHVSILSREFKIPCIVGVMHITQILHDGDFVEVDAIKGLVRVMER